MAIERTLSILKPDAIARSLIGQINARCESAGLRIIAARMQRLTKAEAAEFYQMHAARPFFTSLIEFMCSGPILVQVLEGEQAISRYRDLMGATDPSQAAPGTLRADFADSIESNIVHGSDSLEAAKREIQFFFDTVD